MLLINVIMIMLAAPVVIEVPAINYSGLKTGAIDRNASPKQTVIGEQFMERIDGVLPTTVIRQQLTAREQLLALTTQLSLAMPSKPVAYW